MRVAPPVQAPSCGAGLWRAVQQGLVGWATATAGLWAFGHWQGLSAGAVSVSLGLGLGTAWLVGRRISTPPLSLRWDGAQWSLQTPGIEARSGQVRLMLDLGGWMLVGFVPDTGPGRVKVVWLPLRRGDAPESWRALRIALYAAYPGPAASAPSSGPQRAA